MPLALALGRVPVSNLCTSTLGTAWCGCFQEQWLYFTKSWDKPFFPFQFLFPILGAVHSETIPFSFALPLWVFSLKRENLEDLFLILYV